MIDLFANLNMPYLPSFYVYLAAILLSLSFSSWIAAAKLMFAWPSSQQSQRGFTLIEIMLVLAIAGLIMVIVFLAVAGAQRSQRDRARQDVVNRAIAAINSYAGNHNGTTAPACTTVAVVTGQNIWCQSTINVTIPGTLTSPTVNNSAPPATPAANNIYWLTGTAPSTTLGCGGSYTTGYIAYTIENGTNATYCIAY